MQRDEFERLALDQLPSVHRLAWQLTRRRDLAEDLVQEVYLRAFRPDTIKRFEQRDSKESPESAPPADKPHADSIRSWLFTITHNTFYTLLKKQRIRTRNTSPQMGAGGGAMSGGSAVGVQDDPSPPESEPLQLEATLPPAWELGALDWDTVDERLKRSIDSLPDEYRQVLLLWSVHEMKYREIAQMLDVPIGTVMSRLFRARRLLSDALGGEFGPASDLDHHAHQPLGETQS